MYKHGLNVGQGTCIHIDQEKQLIFKHINYDFSDCGENLYEIENDLNLPKVFLYQFDIFYIELFILIYICRFTIYLKSQHHLTEH